MTEELFVFARDPDEALERLGSGADMGYSSAAAAFKNHDPDYHADKPLYRVEIARVAERVCEACGKRHGRTEAC